MSGDIHFFELDPDTCGNASHYFQHFVPRDTLYIWDWALVNLEFTYCETATGNQEKTGYIRYPDPAPPAATTARPPCPPSDGYHARGSIYTPPQGDKQTLYGYDPPGESWPY